MHVHSQLSHFQLSHLKNLPCIDYIVSLVRFQYTYNLQLVCHTKEDHRILLCPLPHNHKLWKMLTC